MLTVFGGPAPLALSGSTTLAEMSGMTTRRLLRTGRASGLAPNPNSRQMLKRLELAGRKSLERIASRPKPLTRDLSCTFGGAIRIPA
jgi:hypothetical protein